MTWNTVLAKYKRAQNKTQISIQFPSVKSLDLVVVNRAQDFFSTYLALAHLVSLCRRLPVLRADDGEADLALLIHVRVVDPRLERDLGRLERVFRGELENMHIYTCVYR